MTKTPFLLLLALTGCLLQSDVQAQQQQKPFCDCVNFVPTGKPVCATYNINFFDEAAMRCFNRCNKADLRILHYGRCTGPRQRPPASNSGRRMSG
ncbi:hypothetical protein TKK_0006542 [Trichogramma kaykai]